MRAYLLCPPSPPLGFPRRVAMISLPSRHFSRSYSPASQIVTVPAPYSPLGMLPSNEPYSSGWSSVCTASRFRLGAVGTPFGNAHETLSLIHISEPTRQAEISYAVFCL